jgi:hypothetical protein
LTKIGWVTFLAIFLQNSSGDPAKLWCTIFVLISVLNWAVLLCQDVEEKATAADEEFAAEHEWRLQKNGIYLYIFYKNYHPTYTLAGFDRRRRRYH